MNIQDLSYILYTNVWLLRFKLLEKEQEWFYQRHDMLQLYSRTVFKSADSVSHFSFCDSTGHAGLNGA